MARDIKEDIEWIIYHILVDEFCVVASPSGDDITNDLGLDSIDRQHLFLKCDEKFSIITNDYQKEDIETISKLITHIECEFDKGRGAMPDMQDVNSLG